MYLFEEKSTKTGYVEYLRREKSDSSLAQKVKARMGQKGFKELSKELGVNLASLYRAAYGKEPHNKDDWHKISIWLEEENINHSQ